MLILHGFIRGQISSCQSLLDYFRIVLNPKIQLVVRSCRPFNNIEPSFFTVSFLKTWGARFRKLFRQLLGFNVGHSCQPGQTNMRP